MHCAAVNTAVNQEAYRFLNERHQDPAIARLRDQRCLLLTNDTYEFPARVFWSDHPFGRFRRQLGAELRRYNGLFQRLGIREVPTHEDASKVLSEITIAFGSVNKPLDDAAQSVVMACWCMFETALQQGTVSSADLASLAEVKCVPNAVKLLCPPNWMFFEDRAGLAAKFEGFLSSNVIARPIGASQAMAAAGVRTLVSAVEVELLECQNPSESTLVTQRVRERRLQLARVLEAQSSGGNRQARLVELDAIRFESADFLQVRYKLSAFDRTLMSKPESCPALFRAQSQLLSFVSVNDRLPWAPIARELALALYPAEEPGRIAPGLKEVLAADSVAEAIEILNQLGFAVWESAAPAIPSGSATITELGGTTTPPSDLAPGTASPGGGPDMTASGYVDALLGPGAAPPTPLPPGTNQPETPQRTALGTSAGGPGSDTSGSATTGGGSRTGAMPPQRAPRRGKLRSYVLRDPTPPEEPPNTDAAAGRSAVSAAGVARVKAFERTANRDPKEMEHHHPGYDIESRDQSGEIARYIEVKSLSGHWGQDGVGLTSTQFAKARELGSRYWLYVVEKADTSNARIHRVQNPANKVDQYLYDDGWQQEAEDVSS